MTQARVAKIDEEQNLVFGWAYVSVKKTGEEVVDHSLEMIEPDELEQAAYLFNLSFRDSGVMHEGDVVGKMVESVVFTEKKLEMMGLEKSALPIGWWVGFYIEDDKIFAKVKDGTYKMFSIQGMCLREEIVE